MEMQSDSQEIHNVPLHYPAPGEKQRLFVDMDGTLAVFTPVDELETLYQEGYFRNLDPHINVVEAVREIINNYPEIEVHILSAYLTDSQYALREKNAWLDQYLPEIDQSHRIFGPCGSDKKEWIPGGIRTTDHLLDDYTKNLNNWQPPARGIKLLNAINHTRGTWQHDRIRYDRPPADLAAGIVDIMQGRQQVFDDKVSQRTELKIQNQVVSFYSGQMNAVLSALGPNGETIGYIKYAEFQEAPYIQYIEVKEDHRRQGVATALLRELQNLYKSQEIDWGMTTEDGTKLKEAVTYGVEDFEVKSLVERLQAAKAALQINEGKLNELYKVENLTQEQSLEFERLGTDWDTLVEEIRDLERELDGRNIERTFIKMAEENERSGNMAQNDMVKIQSAGRSNYDGYVALMQFDRDKPWGENGAKVFLGKSANYDSRGNYDNSDNSLVLISENHKMLGFLCGEGWVESQQAMINNGAFSAADYAEFAQLKEGVLKQFQDAQIREVRFSIDINQRERGVESGVSFAYPEWAGQTETYNERLETVFWWEEKNDIPGEDRAVAYHRDDSGARAFSTAKNWADVERRYSEILGENDGEIVRLTDQEKDFLRNLAAYDLLYAKAGPILEAFEKQNYAEYPTARDFFLDERSRQSPAPWGLELAEGSAPARLVIMTTERIGYPDAIHEIAYNQPMDDEDYVDYREDPESFLERTYARLGNAGAQPSNYYGHSPSVGDAIVVMSQNGVTAHYVANFGFDLAPEIDRVMSHEQQRAVRMGMTVREEMALLEKLNDFAYANGDKQLFSATEIQTKERLEALREEYIPVFNLADIRGVNEREQDKLQVLHGWEEANNVENPITIYVDGVYYVSNSAVRAALNGSDSNSHVGAGERLQAEINNRFEKAAREISEGYPHFYRLHASPRPLGDQGQYDFFVQRYERSTTEPGVIPGDIVYIGDSKTAIEVTNHLNAGSEYGEYLEENFELRRQLGMGALMGDVSKWMVGGQSEELSELRDWRVDRVTRAMEAAGYSLDPIESSAERGVFNGDYGARMEFETVLEAEEWLEGVVFDDPEMSDAVEKIMHPERFVLEGLSQQDMTNLIFEYENLHNIPATNDFIPEVDRMTAWDAEHSVAVIKPVYGENYVFDAQAVAEARCREILSTESRENIHQAYNAILEAQQERMGLEIGGLAGRLQEQAAGDMNRQDSPWGSWFARISHPDRPQDYIELDITGYSTRNSVIESATLVLNGNVHEQIQINEMSFDDYGNEEGFDTGFAAAAAELAKRFDPSIAENYVLYAAAGWSEHTLEEHYQMLRDRGFDDMPNYEAYNARMAEAERFREILNSAPEFRYQLLHRMKADCDYYLGYGNRNPRNLWASSVEEQIATMRAIWNSFPENAKPEWLSFEDIQQYEDSMANSQNIEERSEKVAEENQIRIAIESTDDYYEPGFHSDLIDSDIQNEDGSYGKVKDYYRIVAINESGRVAAFDDRIFESSAEARAAVAELPGLELVTYDDLVHEAEKIISHRAQAQRSEPQLTILFRDEQNDIEAGINADGDLYLSGSGSGYNLADTIENRRAIERDIERYTGQQVDLVGDMQEPEIEDDNGTISFYVAESMEFPILGEYHEGLTLQEAFRVYDSIPSERLNGGKGIGFDLQDGSIHAGQFALLFGNEIQTDVINEIEHFRNSPLVQKAIADCTEELNRRNGIVREQPSSFIANYYVVEDLNDAPLSVQEFKNLDVAMSAYAALPSNKMKALGIQNTNELPGSLDFIQCRDGVDTLLFDNTQVPGWDNPEIKEAVLKIMDALEQMMKNAHREELNANANIASILNRCEAMGYSEEQMKDVQSWVTRNVPDFILEILASQDLDYYQFLEIRYGLYDELTPEQFALFAKKEFGHLQMLEIREGFAKGLTVEQVAAYAKPELDPDQMFRIRNMLQDSFTLEEVSILADPNFTVDEADQIERDLRNGLPLEEAMKNAATVLAQSYKPIPNHYYYPDLDLDGTADELFTQARNGYIDDLAALAQLQEILNNPAEQKTEQAFYVGILKEIAEDKGDQPYVFAQMKKDILDGVNPEEVDLGNGLTLEVRRERDDILVALSQVGVNAEGSNATGASTVTVERFLHMTEMEFTELVSSVYAYNMALEQRELEEERSVEPLVDISDISYDDEGYLHFTVEADGYQLEGLYRVIDPENGDDMELVSIDFGDRHPIIERQWDRIADALYDEAYDRYNELIDQRFEHKDRLVQAMALAGYIYNEQASTKGHHVFDHEQGGRTFVNLQEAYRWFEGYMMLADHPLEVQMERILTPEQYESPIPEGDEWYYNDPERGDVMGVHYNPDSNAGGQFVQRYIPYASLAQAGMECEGSKDRFFDILDERTRYTELIDIDTLEFKEAVFHYKETAPDYIRSEGGAMEKLVKLATQALERAEEREVIQIGANQCTKFDEWKDGQNTYVLGNSVDDNSFYYAIVNGSVANIIEYDEAPSRDKVESDFVDLEAARDIDRHEAEFGADGRRAFPNLNADEAVFRLDDSRYLYIQEYDEGYDYTIYDADMKELDGGQLDNMDLNMEQARNEILALHDMKPEKIEAISIEEYERIGFEAERRNRPLTYSENEGIVKLAERIDNFMYDYDYYTYADDVGIDLEARSEHRAHLANALENMEYSPMIDTFRNIIAEEEAGNNLNSEQVEQAKAILYDLTHLEEYQKNYAAEQRNTGEVRDPMVVLAGRLDNFAFDANREEWSSFWNREVDQLAEDLRNGDVESVAQWLSSAERYLVATNDENRNAALIREARDLSYTLGHLDLYQQFYNRNVASNAAIPIEEFKRDGRTLEGSQIPGRYIPANSIGYADRSEIFNAVRAFEEANDLPAADRVIHNGTYDDKDFLYQGYNHHVARSHRNDLSIQPYMERLTAMAEDKSKHISLLSLVSEVYYAQQNGLTNEQIDMILTDAESRSAPLDSIQNLRHACESGLTQEQIEVLIGEDSFAQESLMAYMAEGGNIENAKALKGCDVAQYYILSGHLSKGDFGPDMAQAIIQAGKVIKDWTMADFDRQKAELGQNEYPKFRFSSVDFEFFTEYLAEAAAADKTITTEMIVAIGKEFVEQSDVNSMKRFVEKHGGFRSFDTHREEEIRRGKVMPVSRSEAMERLGDRIDQFFREMMPYSYAGGDGKEIASRLEKGNVEDLATLAGAIKGHRDDLQNRIAEAGSEKQKEYDVFVMKVADDLLYSVEHLNQYQDFTEREAALDAIKPVYEPSWELADNIPQKENQIKVAVTQETKYLGIHSHKEFHLRTIEDGKIVNYDNFLYRTENEAIAAAEKNPTVVIVPYLDLTREVFTHETKEFSEGQKLNYEGSVWEIVDIKYPYIILKNTESEKIINLAPDTVMKALNKEQEDKEKNTQDGVALPEEKKDPKDQLAQQLEQGIRNVLDSENFKNWLDTSRKMFLNNYSFNNAILVWLQRPDASYTMGYEQWKDYGRSVAKGANGIKIFVPVIAYEKKEGALWTMIKGNLDKQLRDDPTLPQAVYRIGMSKLEVTKANGLYGLRVNGKEMGIRSEKDMQKFIRHNVLGKVAMYFTVGTVFDVKDTVVPEHLWVKKGFTKAEMVKDENGKPVKNRRGEYKIINTPERQAKFQADLDMSVPEIDPAKAAILYESLKAVSERNGIHVYEKDRQDDDTLQGGADGYFSREFSKENPKGFIVMPTDLEPTKAVSVMLHEMSHSELHGNLTKLAQQMGEDKIPSQMREIQAESVAYLVGKNFGIETDMSSFQYLAAYTQGFELQALSKSIEVIYNECKQLTNELKTELEIRGLNMDLSEREPAVMDKEAVQALSKTYVGYTLEQNDRIADIEKEMPDLVEQNRGKDSAIAVLVAQASNVQRQKEDIALIQAKVTELEKADSYAGQKECFEQIEAAKNRVENYKKDFADLTVQFQDLSRSEQSLKDRFVADPVATLKDMGANMDYVELGALNNAQIEYLAKSEYVSREFAPLLRNDPAQFADKACERASQIYKVASKNGMFVEVTFCEQWTDKPIVETGALMHPKVADTIIKQADVQIRGLKAEAEKVGDYFPYNKCSLMIYQAANGEITKAFKTRVDIGDGGQGSLIDHLKQIPGAKNLAENFEKATRERGSKEKILFNEISRVAAKNEPEREPTRTAKAKSAKEWTQQISAERASEKAEAKDDKGHRGAAKSGRTTNKDDGQER